MSAYSQPDLSLPSFSFAALCTIELLPTPINGDAGRIFSGYGSPLRYSDNPLGQFQDVRLYFIGRESVGVGEEIPALMCFLIPEDHRGKCHPNAIFEIWEPPNLRVKGTVRALITG
jgi:hypothetical protein